MVSEMSRFYLHLCNGAEVVEDEEGVECHDAATAKAKALEALRDVLAGDLLRGSVNTASFIDVEDEQRQLIARVSFANAVTLESQPCVRPPGLPGSRSVESLS
jgi:hypothetical protein